MLIKAALKDRKKKIKLWIKNYKKTLKCIKCGYNKCHEALEFHHRLPKIKKFSISMAAKNQLSIETIKREIKKCDILCSNCHKEIEYAKRTNK